MKPAAFFLPSFLTNLFPHAITKAQNNKELRITGGTKWYNKPITDNTIKPSISNAIKYVVYASAALCNDTSLKNWSCKSCQNVEGTQLITIFNNNLFGTKGYIAVNDNDQAILLAFRGAKDISNWLSTVTLIKFNFGSVNATGALVHSGFLGAMESISSSFLKTLKALLENPQYSSYKIKVIGHSFGGALATLATIKIKDKLNLSWDKLELYTYGQPRIGNVKFAEWFDSLPITVARSVKYKDPVPRLPPPSFLFYTHHANELFVNETSINYCNSSVLEDPNCALSVPRTELDPKTHGSYFDVSLETPDAC